jgi:hypothetical protein
MKNIYKVSLCLTVLALSALSSQAQPYVLGSFQGAADPTDAGWINAQSGNPIATDPACSFPAAGVPGYTQSLDISAAGFAGDFGYPSLQLQFSPAEVTAFNANSYITFTFSVPAGTYTGGYSQIYNLVLNAPGYGYNNQSWANAQETGSTNSDQSGMPNYYFGGTDPLMTQVVTFNYSSVKAAIIAGGESYLQMTFQGNQGGGAPTDWYINNVELSTQPFGVDGVVLGSFQGPGDPTDAGWTNVNTGLPITADTEDSFVAAGVAGFPLSLSIAGIGGGGVGTTNDPNLELTLSPSQIAAFQANNYLTFTFSDLPAGPGTNEGYSQMYAVQLNTASGTINLPWSLAEEQGNIGNDANGEPDYGYYAQFPLESQQVTINYSSILPQIAGATSLQLEFLGNFGGGAPTNMLINEVELSQGPYGGAALPPPPPKPTLGAVAAKPGLRIFAGSSADTYDREQVDTYNYGDESFVGHSGATYSFTLQDYPVAPGLQCQIFLVPPAQLQSGVSYIGPTSDAFIEYQATNSMWLLITGMTANSDGSSGYNVQLAWKTNLPNANPNILAFTNGVGVVNGVYTSIAAQNQNPVGTWTLQFTTVTPAGATGVVTGPMGVNLPFTISDPTFSSDFAAPVIATFGLQPNTVGNEGLWIDYASISISGTANPLSENFVTDLASGITAITGAGSSGYWDTSDSVAPASVVLVNADTPLWVNWTLPDAGYGLAVTPLLPAIPANFANLNAFNGGPLVPGYVLPEQYNQYEPGETIPASSRAGGTNWTLIPSYCLPSNVYPSAQDAYFILANPPPVN